ncbi:MAG: DoxX family protein, partial [Planctomycetales bacterium]|nr:DoxX family protein [Planctomycetales bacterium]
MVPDAYGAVRMDLTATKQHWELYHNRAAGHFGFDEKQRKAAGLAYKRALAQLSFWFDDTADDRREHYNEAKRLFDAQADRSLADVEFRREWIATETQKLDAQRNGWLRQIDGFWNAYEADVNAVATEEQLARAGRFALTKPGAGFVSSDFADAFIPWFTFLVGVCLVLGLFTRVAAVAGAAFLASVVASQPPFVAGASDTNYQIVLLLGLLVCAAVGAGRWGGLDFFLGLCCRACCGRCCSGSTSGQAADPAQSKADASKAPASKS